MVEDYYSALDFDKAQIDARSSAEIVAGMIGDVFADADAAADYDTVDKGKWKEEKKSMVALDIAEVD